MTTSFVSVAGNNTDGWDAVIKTFPLETPKLGLDKNGQKINLIEWNYKIVTGFIPGTHHNNEGQATTAAKVMAQRGKFAFISPGESIVVLAPLPPSIYVPAVLNADGSHLLMGVTQDYIKAKAAANVLAEQENLTFVETNSFEIKEGLNSFCVNTQNVSGDYSLTPSYVENDSSKNFNGLPEGSSILAILKRAGL